MRKAEVTRTTKETRVDLELVIGSYEESSIDTGVPFFDHMLYAMARHGALCVKLKCVGDTDIDDHHSVEDVGIVMGTAVRDALGDKSGINRFGDALVPMDEALCQCALDISGRPFFSFSGNGGDGYIGAYNCELTSEFFRALATGAGINLHIRVISGDNRHHIHEAVFKSFGRALREAVTLDPVMGNRIPSTKGVI